MKSDKLFIVLGSSRFWLLWDVFFALANTASAIVADKDWMRLLNAWCSVVLVVCSMIMWYKIDTEEKEVTDE